MSSFIGNTYSISSICSTPIKKTQQVEKNSSLGSNSEQEQEKPPELPKSPIQPEISEKQYSELKGGGGDVQMKKQDLLTLQNNHHRHLGTDSENISDITSFFQSEMPSIKIIRYTE